MQLEKFKGEKERGKQIKKPEVEEPIKTQEELEKQIVEFQGKLETLKDRQIKEWSEEIDKFDQKVKKLGETNPEKNS